MKKLVSLLLILTLLVVGIAFAEIPDISNLTSEELVQLAEAIAAAQDSNSADDTADVSTETEEASGSYSVLEKGMKNDEVKKLQERLIELNYLSGSADGDFGGKTKAAIELFQKEAGLDVTGIADVATQEAIFSDDAPIAKVYNKLTYKDVLRDPNKYKGQLYTFSGKVFQLVGEQEYDDYVYTVLFISADNSSSKLCNVTYRRPKDAPRILEDDQVTVYATFDDIYTYETVRGNSNTILDFTADTVTVK